MHGKKFSFGNFASQTLAISGVGGTFHCDNLGGLSMLQSAAMTSLKSGIMSGAVPMGVLGSKSSELK